MGVLSAGIGRQASVPPGVVSLEQAGARSVDEGVVRRGAGLYAGGGESFMMETNRRRFLGAAIATAASYGRIQGANDRLRFGAIGTGERGQYLLSNVASLANNELVAVCDVYQPHLLRAKGRFGADAREYVDHRELLDRKDVDAVIVATPDHWHVPVTIDAVRAGKDVYCEKPMIHVYADGPEMIETARATKRVIQVGSQRVSSVIYAKAKELLASGAIGQLNMVTARWDRNSSIGAWSYTVPPDASPETCDWPRFEGTAPKIPFNAEHFFQWRKWKAYGTGVAGDLFVHLFSGTNFITGSHGPTRGMATGGLRFWKDGRDVPDVMLGLFDYREGFNLSLHVNFVDGGEESEGLLFTGSEGTMDINNSSVSVNRVPLEKEPGLMIDTFTNAMQKQILADYREKYPRINPEGAPPIGFEKFVAPAGYLDSYDHFSNFFNAVRTRKPVVEDAVFGFRAAGAALLSNLSIERGAVVGWDPDAMKLL